MNGGRITITADDDGIHTDSNLVINGGQIDILDSYEGLEGYTITMNGGYVTLIASDDGVNAAGGDDGGTGGMFGPDSFNSGSNASGIYVQINGGTLILACNGDGLDSNGSLYMNGGTVYVNGPVSGGNGMVDIGDWGYEAVITGGTIITAGTSDMAVNFGSSSSQPSLLVYLGSNYQSGTEIALKDASGNTVLSYEPLVTFSAVIFSDSQMQVGGTYTVYVDGKELTDVTLTSTSMSIDSSGNEVYGGGMGGMGGFPGGGQGGQSGFPGGGHGH